MSENETSIASILDDDDFVPRSKRLYCPDRPDLISTWRCLWPSYDPTPKIAKIAESIDTPVWIELGLGPNSIMHTVPAKRVIVFDTRPWALRLMDQAHDPDIWTHIASMVKSYNMSDMTTLLHMRNMASRLDTPVKQAMAFLLLAAVGGKTLRFKTFDASLAIGGMIGKPAALRRSRHCVMATMILNNAVTAIRMAARETRNSAKHVHIHINEVLPVDEALNMLLSLRNIGFSWSMAIHDPRLVHDVKRVADIFDWHGTPFAWCPRNG